MHELTRRQAIAASFGLAASQFRDRESFECSKEAGILYVLYYPPGATKIRGVTEPIENSEVAKACVEHLQAGSAVTIPHIVDEHGNRMWELQVFDLRRALEIAAS